MSSHVIKISNLFKVGVIVVLSFLLLWFFFNKININTFGNDFVRNNNQFDTINTRFFFTSIFFTSFLEELFFRKGLKYSFFGCLFLLTGIIYTITYILLYQSFVVTNYTFLVGVIVFLVLGFLIYFNTEKIKLFYSINPKTIIIISIVAFAYSHYPLYSNANDFKNIIFSPLLLSEYLLTGVLFSLIRIKFSFVFAVIAHILWNYLVTFQ